MASLIYLASPYSHEEAHIRLERYIRACIVAGRLITEGHDIFCPVAHSHQMSYSAHVRYDDPCWYRLDNAILAKCDELWILMLDGWKESKGIAAELAIAVERDMPVKYIEPS